MAREACGVAAGPLYPPRRHSGPPWEPSERPQGPGKGPGCRFGDRVRLADWGPTRVNQPTNLCPIKHQPVLPGAQAHTSHDHIEMFKRRPTRTSRVGATSDCSACPRKGARVRGPNRIDHGSARLSSARLGLALRLARLGLSRRTRAPKAQYYDPSRMHPSDSACTPSQGHTRPGTTAP